MFDSSQKVYAQDDHIGELHAVVLSPADYKVNQVIVKFKHKEEYRIVPVDFVQGVDKKGIHLTADQATIEGMREFKPIVVEKDKYSSINDQLTLPGDFGVLTDARPGYTEAHSVDEGVTPGAVFVGKGAKVFTELGEEEGKIQEIALDETGHQLAYLAIHRHGMRHHDIVVTPDQVKEWQPDAVVLNMDKEAMKHLPSHPDEA